MMVVYLAIPFDPIPDFIPIRGYVDDAIVVTAVLRSVVRRAVSRPSEPTGRAPTTVSPDYVVLPD
jgi:uncharacterized membrane protein YkvA (DUF1232 family)